MLKKLISLLLAVCMLFCLSACGATETSSNPTNTPSESQLDTSQNTDKITSTETENSQVSSNTEETNENDNTQSQTQMNQSKPTIITNQPTHTHSYSNATCTSPKKCSCGATNGNALGHNYSGKYCTRCGASNPNYKENTQSNSNHTHYYSSRVTTEATCAKEGVRTYTCSCGNSYTEKISKTTYHDWEYATCTKPKTCKDCGKTEGSAEEHSYYSSGKCSRCGQQNPIVTETLSKCSLEIPSLPKSVSYYGYSNKLYSTVNVTNITYKFECDNDGKIELEIYFSGTKTYDYQGSGQSSTSKISWKLYGPDGSIIRSDTFYSPSLAVGESFSNKSEDALYSWDNGTPGKYRLEILNTN